MTCWSGICGSLFCVPNTTCIIFHFTYGNTCALLLYVTAFLFSSSCFIFFFFYSFFILYIAESAFRHEVLPSFFCNIFPANRNCFKKVYHKPFTSACKEVCPRGHPLCQAGWKCSLLQQKQQGLLPLCLSHPTSKLFLTFILFL